MLQTKVIQKPKTSLIIQNHEFHPDLKLKSLKKLDNFGTSHNVFKFHEIKIRLRRRQMSVKGGGVSKNEVNVCKDLHSMGTTELFGMIFNSQWP